MTTGYLPLALAGAVLPDGSGSGNASPTPVREVSGGTQTSNSPKATQLCWDFDADADQHAMWSFLLPGDYSSGGTLRLKWKMVAATAGNVVLKAAAAIATDASTDDDAAVFDTVVGSGAVAVPGTQGQLKETSLALTMTGAAANRKMTVMAGRDADSGSDTASGALRLVGATFEYTAA